MKGGEIMKEICLLIYNSLESRKQEGYGLLLGAIIQNPISLAFYAFLIARWIMKKLFQLIHIF